MLVEPQDGRIVGAHLVGRGAQELIHAFAFALQQGITARQLKENVFAYPTFHSDLKHLI